MIEPGQNAPDFALPSQNGVPVRLSDYRGKKAVVLYFYPKDDTPGCTREACGFRDGYEQFLSEGAEVLGVSADSEDAHARFAGKYRLPFPLLSDGDGVVRQLYGVKKTLGFLPGRATFVIDRAGVVRHVFSAQFAAERHITEALRGLKESRP